MLLTKQADKYRDSKVHILLTRNDVEVTACGKYIHPEQNTDFRREWFPYTSFEGEYSAVSCKACIRNQADGGRNMNVKVMKLVDTKLLVKLQLLIERARVEYINAVPANEFEQVWNTLDEALTISSELIDC